MSIHGFGDVTLHKGEVSTYEEEFPRDQGPPPVASYGGPKVLDAREPVYILELDSGAFRALWELLEGEAKHRYPTKNIMAGVRAYLRAVDSFRSCYWAKHPPKTELRLKSRKQP
jgi:hypothetical protein